ncbi:hypothetical protein IFO70_21070 [Phormidium tenue FACHB-886]|nr:hypothetical protein [Phormidium tenue FACHB-886]
MAYSSRMHSDNSLVGTNNDDILRVLDRNGRLFGLAGNDRLFGNVGNDVLVGGTGDDSLFGNDGNDILVGTNFSAGSANQIDKLAGGLGADTFVLEDASTAIIQDFLSSERDKIRLKGKVADYSLKVSESFTLITLKNVDGSTNVIGQVNGTNLSFAQDFVFG